MDDRISAVTIVDTNGKKVRVTQFKGEFYEVLSFAKQAERLFYTRGVLPVGTIKGTVLA